MPTSLRTRARKDLLFLGLIILIGCAFILRDPDHAFEWIARHEEVQVDEFLTAITLIGSGFAVFSWRRWTELAAQIAEYKRLQIELQAMHRDALKMGETDDLLQSCLSTEEAYKIVIRHFEMEFPQISGAIFALVATESVDLVASWGQPAVSDAIFAVKDCWSLRRGRLHVSRASDPKLACEHISTPLPESAMCLPMMAQGETLGVLYLDNSARSEGSPALFLTESQQRTVKTLAEHLALAVANLKLRETLRTQSIRDPLTGLFNRRYMEESLEREFRRAVRKNMPLAILMVDLDHFKQFNDTHGHEAGDAVLRELAKVCQAQLRAEDIVSRYGGEEFLLILPEASVEAAQDCAERLRMAAQAIRIHHYGQVIEGVRLSVGVAIYPQHGDNVDAVTRAADDALYRAKEMGRDRVVVAG